MPSGEGIQPGLSSLFPVKASSPGQHRCHHRVQGNGGRDPLALLLTALPSPHFNPLLFPPSTYG